MNTEIEHGKAINMLGDFLEHEVLDSQHISTILAEFVGFYERLHGRRIDPSDVEVDGKTEGEAVVLSVVFASGYFARLAVESGENTNDITVH